MSSSLISTRKKALPSPLPATGFVRLASIIAPNGPLPISRSTWFLWQREGRAPAPIRLSSRITAYRVEDVNEFISQLTQANSP